MNPPRIITAAERAARRGQSTQPKPIAQFRVKGGCLTCKPIPVLPRQPANPQLPDTHANST